MHSILKIVFLEIQNKAIRPVLSGPVTYNKRGPPSHDNVGVLIGAMLCELKALDIIIILLQYLYLKE